MDTARPLSLLENDSVDRLSLGMGVLISLGVHAALPLALAGLAAALATFSAQTPDAPKERTVVEARFVRLGKPFDPRKLPNRKVPKLSTALANDPLASKTPRELDDAGQPQDAVPDNLTRLGDRAQAFAEIAKAEEQEGDPEGTAEGTDDYAEAGDLYAGKLKGWMEQGFSVPTVIPTDELKTLRTDVDVLISENGTVARFSLRSESGNSIFDQAVLAHLESKQGQAVPEPPSEIAKDYLGRTVGFLFSGRDLR